MTRDFLYIDPAFSAQLGEKGLAEYDDFFRPSDSREMIRIHASRPADVCVMHLRGQKLFIKREHATPWKEYARSAWAGCGFVPRLLREAQTLLALWPRGCSVPRPIAWGRRGSQSFLVVAELPEMVNLITYALADTDPSKWLHLTRALGLALARLHREGVAHRGLNPDHVFVGDGGRSVAFIDLDRARFRWRFGWLQEFKDLRRVNQSLRQVRVPDQDRRRFVSEYLSARFRPEGAVSR